MDLPLNRAVTPGCTSIPRDSGRPVVRALVMGWRLVLWSAALAWATTEAPHANDSVPDLPGSPGAVSLPERGSSAPAHPLRFDSEIIRLAIIGDSLEVDGTYHLVCDRPHLQQIPLFYPFPVDTLLAGARMMEGLTRVDGGSWEALRFEPVPGASGVRWWTPPCSGEMIEIRGRYRQGLRQNYARYIVTTTRRWQQPLRHARFEIRLPEGAVPIDFSFPFVPEPDTSGGIDLPAEPDRSVVYVWETDSFYPDRDVVVRWQ